MISEISPMKFSRLFLFCWLDFGHQLPNILLLNLSNHSYINFIILHIGQKRSNLSNDTKICLYKIEYFPLVSFGLFTQSSVGSNLMKVTTFHVVG
jgi:hypothetical protein